MKPVRMNDRQVHLDFHTSPEIENIGGEFDEDQFAEALRLGHVGAINLFAVCHHGWAYYDSQLGFKHPHLKTNLLERQIEACKSAGVESVIYITVRWNERVAKLHPDWVVRDLDGSKRGHVLHAHSTAPYYLWDTLCLGSPYIDEVVLPTVEEVMDKFNPSGIWMDITRPLSCSCEYCERRMKERGLDPSDPAERDRMAYRTRLEYLERVSQLVWSKNSKATLFHNQSQRRRQPEEDKHNSHQEIESLPTGQWGYDHFPCNAAFFKQRKGLAVVGMTGKFHTSWGEFGGYKHPNALRWEAAQIASYRCLTCVGDHLNPTGRVDLDTYRLIGQAYQELEERQPWLADAENAAEVAVVIEEDLLNEAETGACKMLLESQIPFAVVDDTMDLDSFKLLILPDDLRLDNPKLRRKIESFVQAGGKILASGFGGLVTQEDRFAVDLGVEYHGPSEWKTEYVKARPNAQLLSSGISEPFIVYRAGASVRPRDAEVLAETWEPYFNRTTAHFSGHREAPYRRPSESPSVTLHQNGGYISQRIFAAYHEWGTRLYRELAMGLLDKLLLQPVLAIGLPSAGRVALNHQPANKRHILHALYATPIQRGKVGLIEDVVPLFDIPVTLRLPSPPKSIRLVPQGQDLPFQQDGPATRFAIPKLELSQLIEIAHP